MRGFYLFLIDLCMNITEQLLIDLLMMTREERAKQFIPFDAMKGLKEALLDREEKHSRVNRHEITEEQQKKNTSVLLKLKKYDTVSVSYYSNFHEITKNGRLTKNQSSV